MYDLVYFDKAASGHNWIYTESRSQAKRISRLLMFRHGFWRWGIFWPAITGEAIFPSYVRWNLKITAGWDNWVGYDFLSDNDKTDEFLERFVSTLIPQINDIRKRTP